MLFWVLVLAVFSHAFAEQTPLEIINQIDTSVKSILSDHSSSVTTTDRLNHYLSEDMVKMIAVNHFIEQVIGDDWHQATTEQREQFRRGLIDMVVSDYASVMKSWGDPNVKSDFRMYPLNSGQLSTKVFGKVSTPTLGETILVFEFIYHNDRWCFTDMSVSGVSFSELYKEEFAGVLRSEGFDGLLQLVDS